MTLALGGSPPQTLSPLIKKENDSFYKKCMTRFMIVVGIFIFIMFLIPALADSVFLPHIYKLGETEWNTAELKNDLNAAAFWFVYYTYGAFPQFMADSGVLSIDLDASYMATFQDFYDTTAAIGMGLAVIWVMLDLIEKAQIDQMSPEVLIRWCIKLVTAIIIVDNADSLAKMLISVGNELVSGSVALSATTESIITGFFTKLKTASVLKALSIIIECLVPALAMMFCILMMLTQLFGRVLEAGIRFGFMPIGISDAFTHGLNSAGMRYIKKFFAVCIQGAVLYAIMIAGAKLMSVVSLGGEDFGFLSSLGIISQLVVAFSMVGLMLKSQSIINDIAGV